MGHTLKLDIYCFSIKKRGSQEEDKISFGDFFRQGFSKEDSNDEPINKDSLINRFISEFIDSFNKKFVLNNKGTKGIAADFLKPYPSKNIIDGMINGGHTGIDQNIYDKANPEESEDVIEKNKIAALPYYFKMWTPFDGTVGVLMIQSYSDMGVNSLVNNQVKSFFGDKGFIINKYKHVPEEYKDRFKKKSKVYKVSFIKQGLSGKARESLNPVFTEQENLKVRIDITGFEKSPVDFWKIFRSKKIINNNLSALEMVNDDDFETVATYRDEEGRKSSAKVSKELDIFPTYYLHSDLKMDDSDYPDYDKIKKHTNGILDIVKKEINYTPEYVD